MKSKQPPSKQKQKLTHQPKRYNLSNKEDATTADTSKKQQRALRRLKTKIKFQQQEQSDFSTPRVYFYSYHLSSQQYFIL